METVSAPELSMWWFNHKTVKPAWGKKGKMLKVFYYCLFYRHICMEVWIKHKECANKPRLYTALNTHFLTLLALCDVSEGWNHWYDHRRSNLLLVRGSQSEAVLKGVRIKSGWRAASKLRIRHKHFLKPWSVRNYSKTKGAQQVITVPHQQSVMLRRTSDL